MKGIVFVSAMIGIVAAVLIFLYIGVPTDIVENPYYVRMVPVRYFDIFFLVADSVLFGLFIGLNAYILIHNRISRQGSRLWKPAEFGTAGTLGSYFAVSCPVCIKFLVWIFGASILMKYYDPLRPVVGFVSIALLLYAVYYSFLIARKQCRDCYEPFRLR